MNRYKGNFYTLKAKKEGYLARSVYKLNEIMNKTSCLKYFLSRPCQILDLGAAPGSWTQYFLSHLPQANIVGLDQKPWRVNSVHTQFIHASLLDIKTHDELFRLAPFDFIVSDILPHTTGYPIKDSQNSLDLVSLIGQLSFSLLKKNKKHSFVLSKIFPHNNEEEFMQIYRSRFQSVRLYRPQAIRAHSREIYILARGLLTEK